jgi:hypothetical protein
MSPLPLIFDRKLYLQRQVKSSPATSAPLIERIAEDLADRLALITRSFDAAVLIGNESFTSHLTSSGKCANLLVRDPTPDDALNLEPLSCDAIFSILDLQTVNDVPGYLAQAARALKPDGLLMLCFFAGETLHELRDCWLSAETEITGGASPRVAPMIGIRELGGLLQRAGLALPVADIDRSTLRYGNAIALMQDVKAAGYSNPLIGRSQRFASRRMITAVATKYQEQYGDSDGRIRATLEIAWANAWKPHPSQPQPLKPGSAKMRLADALKVTEEKL